MGIRATATGDRLDWDDIKDRIDMAAIATALLGPAPKRSGRRLLWPCPFHEDHDPSFASTRPSRWKCWPCASEGTPRAGDAVAGSGIPRGRPLVAELAGIVTPSGKPARPRPRGPASRPPEARPRAAGSPPDDRSGCPWPMPWRWSKTPQATLDARGTDALAYLRRGRGLTEATIRPPAWDGRLGVTMPTADGVRFCQASGVTIPWHDGWPPGAGQDPPARGEEAEVCRSIPRTARRSFRAPRRSGPACR